MKWPVAVSVGLAAITMLLILTAPGSVGVKAQNRMNFPLVAEDTGHIALGLALRRLNVSGTFMQTAAHPDDEHNWLYALFTHGMGLRSIDVQTTRGDGGQNEIGPELFQDMAVLRTSELLSAHRLDGAEQYFTRAIDFGYSFDPEEVIKKWGRSEIVGDFVRLIRTYRPDVLLTMNIQGGGGDRAHEATTVLTREAYFAAGNPALFPEQLREGLHPWRPKKLYLTAFGGRSGPGRGRGQDQGPDGHLTRVNTTSYDALLGRTYLEIGLDARSNHKCQGMGGLPPLPGFNGGRGSFFTMVSYQLVDSSIPGAMDKDESSLFEGIDTSLSALAQFAGSNPPERLKTSLNAIAEQARKAQQAFDAGNDASTVAPIEAGLTALRALRAQLGSMGLGESARYEIDFRLKAKEHDYEEALLDAHGLTFDAVADDGLVITGQPVKVSMLAVDRGSSEVSITSVSINGLDSTSPCAAGTAGRNSVYTCSIDAKIPRNAKPTTPYFTDHYWKTPANEAIDIFEPDVPFGAAFRETPFRAVFHLKAGSVELAKEVPIQFRYVKDIYFGDKRMELNVVPSFSVAVAPPLMMMPVADGASPANASGAGAKPPGREVHVSVTNGTKGPAQVTVSLELPPGWSVTPPNAPIAFTHEDESLSARFEITAPAQVKTGDYTLRAVVSSNATGSEKFSVGYQAIEYPHIERRQMIKPAEAVLKVSNVKVAPNLSVGYINGVGDQVPPAIQQLGARLTFISEEELAWGDLSKYDTIVTGVRAYERRDDLRAYNQRLLDYAERGGTVIVQYNKMEFNQAQYGPFPARVSGERVTDETAPVKILVPNHPVFNYPNKIGAPAWDHWVQERGLYFLGTKDSKYTDLVSMSDPFPDNPGEKLGALVEARVGKGRWLYVGLGLWRQLPAGTDGAYQLLANLISLGQPGPKG
jgi:LmbE family N-acetylglucosaminyl deacetylase